MASEDQIIETKPVDVPVATPDPSTPPAADDMNYVSLIFRDGLDLPIEGLEWFVTLPSGQMCTAKSTAQGAITIPVPLEATGQAQVEVKDVTGTRQSVCSIDLAQCNNAVIIRSPKVEVDLTLRPHQQTLPPAPVHKSPLPKPIKKKAVAGKSPPATQPAPVDTHSAWWSANGALKKAWTWLSGSLHLEEQAPSAVPQSAVIVKTLSKAGQPVTVVVGPECPNQDKLRLGRNNVYRTAIVDAAMRLGLIPQALCALMDCEAGKVTEHIPKLGADGKQLKDKKGKLLSTPIRELWNANAGNAQSGAAGLTQFLASTWLGHVLIPGFYIHTQSVANGWVRKDIDAQGHSKWVFVLADGKSTTAPYAKRSTDDNVKKCLAMRMDATWSINAAADYGNANLKLLERKGFKLTSLNNMDKAKLMYLMHHEGEGSGPLFISNTLDKVKYGIAGLRRTFATQLGGNGAALAGAKISAANDDVELSYRRWLATYIDDNFRQASKYFCSDPMAVRDLSDLLELIGGEPVE